MNNIFCDKYFEYAIQKNSVTPVSEQCHSDFMRCFVFHVLFESQTYLRIDNDGLTWSLDLSTSRRQGPSIVVSKAQVSTLKVFHDLFSSITSLKRGISNWRISFFYYFFSSSYLETQTETWLRP